MTAVHGGPAGPGWVIAARLLDLRWGDEPDVAAWAAHPAAWRIPLTFPAARAESLVMAADKAPITPIGTARSASWPATGVTPPPPSPGSSRCRASCAASTVIARLEAMIVENIQRSGLSPSR